MIALPVTLLRPYHHVRSLTILAASLLLMTANHASAALIIGVQNSQTLPGQSGSFEVLLTNPDTLDLDVGGFSFELSVDPLSGVNFTGVATNPTVDPYIFASGSWANDLGFPFSYDVFPNTTFTALDLSLLPLGENLAAGATVSLGVVTYDLASNVVGGTVIPVILLPFPGTGVSDALGIEIASTLENGSIRASSNQVVPEPMSWTIWLLTIAGVCLYRRRRPSRKGLGITTPD